MSSITIADWLIITATLLGPVLAVQAQKWVERFQERRKQQVAVFATLMTTTAFKKARAESGKQERLI
jgi:hypothetical protein